MDKAYEPLFTPWKIGNCEIKNRIVMTSMGGTSIFGWMEPNHFDKEAANFLLERAKNNAGLILPGIAPIRDIILKKWLYQGTGKFKQLKEFMDEFHKTGCKLFVQLTAGFGRSLAINDIMIKALNNKALATALKPFLDVSYLTASASATPNRWQEDCISRPLTKKEIEQMVTAFAKTAKLCKDAGVDGVEIHAVHEGYLLDQFTMKYTNQRTDEYGGSFEGRYKFPVDIVKAIKSDEYCGKDFPVSLRYSVISKTKGFGQGALPGEDYVEVGRDMEESERAAKYLQDAGYDMLNCDNGTYDAWYWAHPAPYMPDNCNLEDVKHIKKFVDIPVVCAGKMNPKDGAEAIKNGEIDGLGIARQFLTDPQWITKIMNGKEDSIHPCIHCHNACFNMASYHRADGHLVGNDQSLGDNAGMARCALNPETMQSKKYYIQKTSSPKNIAVIGAGIGGMEAARVLKLRGHNVTIYEKSNEVGGIFIAAAAPSFKDKDKDLIKWYAKEMKDLGIEIKFNTEVKDLASIKADEYIIATGSKANKLPKAIDDGKGIEVCDYLRGKVEVGQKVVVVGGGLSGCEVALDLYKKGKTPIIIEMKDDLVAMKGVCLANSSYLRDFFALNKVEVHLQTSLTKITDKGVTVKGKDGKEFNIEADSVLLSIGYKPTPACVEFKEKNKDGRKIKVPVVPKNVHLVGDCNGIGNLRTVVWRAWDVAMKI